MDSPEVYGLMLIKILGYLKRALISHSTVFLTGVLLYYSVFLILSSAVPMIYFKDSIHVRVSNPMEALEVLWWSVSPWKRVVFFLDHTLMAFHGVTMGKVDWQFTFKIRDFLAQLPMAFLTGLYLAAAYDYSSLHRFRCPRRSGARLNKGGLYATPLGVFASSLLNAALWIGGCGSCGGAVGVMFIALLGFSAWLARFLQAAAALGVLSATFYLGYRALRIEGKTLLQPF